MIRRSGIGWKRYSRDQVHLLPDKNLNMANPNDATIDIPLTNVSSQGQTGARKPTDNTNTSPSASAYAPPVDITPERSNEKQNGPAGLHGNGRRRRIDTDESGRLGSPEDGTFTTRVGKIYDKFMEFSVLTRYFIYVLPLTALIIVPIAIGATVAKDAEIGGVRIVWFFTWVEVVWLSLWVSKAFAHYIPYVFQFLCGVVSSGTRKYASVLKALEIPISLVGWSVTSLATFVPVSNA